LVVFSITHLVINYRVCVCVYKIWTCGAVVSIKSDKFMTTSFVLENGFKSEFKNVTNEEMKGVEKVECRRSIIKETQSGFQQVCVLLFNALLSRE